MIVSFALKNQIIRRTDYNIVVAQSKNYLRARFDALSDDWIGPITAIFNDYVVVLDENNECLVPWEVLQNPGVVNVSAFCGDLHTASVATMVVKPSGYTEGETPEPPTPGVYAQLTGLVQNAVDTANSVQQRANAGEFDGQDGKNGADGYSPVATVQQTTGGATITITDKTGTTTANIYNGRDGADGVSPIATVEQADDGVVITITDKSGTTTATAHNGRDGTDGVDGLNAPQIDDTQASPANPWSGAKTDAELAKKMNANQGAENAGKVLGVGEDGGVVPVDASSGIDDTKITTANPWSSAKIVETVCPPFEVTGPIVTCNPVEGYPLHVVSQIVPMQEGEGDPSPENVRPITGWTEANLRVTGRNLFDGSIYGSKNIAEVTIEYDPETQVFTLNGTTDRTLAEQSFGLNIPGYDKAFTLSTDVLSGDVIGDGFAVAFFGAADSLDASNNFINSTLASSKSTTMVCKYKYVTAFWLYADAGVTFDNLKFRIKLEIGSQVTPYEPYNQNSKAITLPFGQTVYGGTLDWNTGVLTIISEKLTFNGSESFSYIEVFKGYSIPKDAKYKDGFLPLCNIAKGELVNQYDGYSLRANYGAFRFQGFANKYPDADSFKAFLQTQNAEVIAELVTPLTIKLTQQEILALSGVNTIYTDTGDTTVSGRADPTTIINQLAARIAALESAATNI